MLHGKALIKSIQKRWRIQPGMLGNSVNPSNGIKILALVVGLSPGWKFDRDYEEAEEHIFYKCQPFDGTPDFVDYVCNLEQVS